MSEHYSDEEKAKRALRSQQIDAESNSKQKLCPYTANTCENTRCMAWKKGRIKEVDSVYYVTWTGCTLVGLVSEDV